MSGWHRLWLVFSILLGAPIFALQYADRETAFISWSGDNAAFWRAAHANDSLQHCDWRTAHVDPENFDNSYLVSCSVKNSIAWASLWALIPGAIIGALGFTIAWVIRGFRK